MWEWTNEKAAIEEAELERSKIWWISTSKNHHAQHFTTHDHLKGAISYFYYSEKTSLEDVKPKKQLVLVMDEFQWMANDRSDLVVVLKMIWDQYLSRSGNVKLILCGSIASFMKNSDLRE